MSLSKRLSGDSNAGSHNPLHQAAYWGRLETAQMLLEEGADVNVRNNEGRTPLHWAAMRGHVDMVKLLLDNGANPNLTNIYSRTPEDEARHERHPIIIQTFNEYWRHQADQQKYCRDRRHSLTPRLEGLPHHQHPHQHRFASYTEVTRPKSASIERRRDSTSEDRSRSRRGSVGIVEHEGRRRSISSQGHRSTSADKRRGSVSK
ncbi:unnamed protein product, partial [Meganyctiphanes norvegica]